MLGGLCWLGQLLVLLQAAGSLEVECPIPDIPHGRLKPAQNLTQGSTATLECNPGYIPLGATTVRCLGRGRWYPRVPACTLGHCSYPPAIDHAERNARGEFLVGTTVTYFCRPGYTLIPDVSPITTCLENFTWSVIPPLCQKLLCPSPAIQHGREITLRTTDYAVGHQVEFQCDPGYILRGSQRIQCGSDGTWRPPVPYCDKACDPPPQIPHGQHSALRTGQFPYGLEVKYSCAEGLSLLGDESIFCTSADGVTVAWSGPAPQCRLVRCPRPAVRGARVAPRSFSFGYGAAVRFSCQEGFELRGDAESRCLEDGAWHPPLPSCQEAFDCGVPMAEVKTLLEIEKLFLEIKKLKVELENLNKPSSDEHTSSFPVGSRVTYTCIQGTIRIPGRSDTVQCLPGARWSKLPEPCGRSCPAPTRLRFAALAKADEIINFFPVGTNVSYACRPGYENTSESSPTSTCLENLAWSEAAELCRRRSCGEPGALPGGRVVPLTDLQFGARAKVSCEDGYKLDGRDFIQCQLKGNDVEWSKLPTCECACGPLPNISHAEPPEDTKLRGSFSVGSQVTYRCLEGFVKRPLLSDTTQCLANSQWSNLPEFCGRSCPSPPRVSFARISQKDETLNFYAVGTTVNYVCRPGYENSTAQLPTSTCLDNLKWSDIPELCHTIPNGKHNGNDTEFMYSSVVMYTCDPGLQLVGNETLHCTTENGVNGTWSGSLPECRASRGAATDQTEPSGAKTAENPYWLVPPVALGILAGIIMRWKDNKKHSYDTDLQKPKKGKDPPRHPQAVGAEKLPVPWRDYFCCATCQDWLRARPGTLCTFSVPTISDGESWSPAGTSSPAKAVDVLRADGAGEAVPERSEAEPPRDPDSNHHICPTCEDWLRAHLVPSRAAVPGEPRGVRGPQGPICPPCADRLHLSLVHSDVTRCPVCPLAGEGPLAHLVPRSTPGCHVCPGCAAPTHKHLCQPRG
ncbi:PREDICTED: complement receptor type 1-like [Chaetura pelagica]|uniref:complement receptor type 1-like n=1 Tax=Chaetura pelagica TaxID=8897 RepID=UPI0005239BED|nr:PREDICTED: complement receptor type 1-like [Chaetura pelagica]